MPKTKIDIRYDLFARAYVTERNGTKAAIAAGYKQKGARVQARRLLTKANVQDLIAKYAERLTKKADVTPERVIAELAKIAFLDPKQFYNENGELIAIHELPADIAAALTGVEVDETFDYKGRGKKKHRISTRTSKIRFAHKVQALQALGNYFKLFDPQMTPTDKNPLYRLIELMEMRSKQIGPPVGSRPQLPPAEEEKQKTPVIEVESEEIIAP